MRWLTLSLLALPLWVAAAEPVDVESCIDTQYLIEELASRIETHQQLLEGSDERIDELALELGEQRAAAAELQGEALEDAVERYQTLSDEYGSVVALNRSRYDMLTALIDKHNELTGRFHEDCDGIEYIRERAREVCEAQPRYADTRICRTLLPDGGPPR